MTQQIFDVGDAPRIEVGECASNLLIEAWDQRKVEVDTNATVEAAGQERGPWRIERANEKLRLRVPHDTTIIVEHVRGNVEASGCQGLDVQRVAGGLRGRQLETLEIEHAGGNVTLERVATLSAGKIGGSLTVAGGTLHVEKVSGNCTVSDAGESVRFGKIDGSLVVEGNGQTLVTGERVRGNLSLRKLRSAELENVSSSATIRDVEGDLRIGNIGGNCEILDAGGEVSIQNVGGSAALNNVGVISTLGNIGGNLTLTAAPLRFDEQAATMQMKVGGSARIELTDAPNLTVNAMAGGSIHADQVAKGMLGRRATLIYGAGTVALNLMVGGNLDLRGGGEPQVAGGAWQPGLVVPPVEPVTPVPPVAPVPPMRPTSPAPATGKTMRMDRAAPQGPSDGEEERILVLRMIADGRITPEQGAQLLQAMR